MAGKVLEIEGRRYHATCVGTDDKRVATLVTDFDDDEQCAGCEDPLGDVVLDDDNDEDEDDEDEA